MFLYYSKSIDLFGRTFASKTRLNNILLQFFSFLVPLRTFIQKKHRKHAFSPSSCVDKKPSALLRRWCLGPRDSLLWFWCDFLMLDWFIRRENAKWWNELTRFFNCLTASPLWLQGFSMGFSPAMMGWAAEKLFDVVVHIHLPHMPFQNSGKQSWFCWFVSCHI